MKTYCVIDTLTERPVSLVMEAITFEEQRILDIILSAFISPQSLITIQEHGEAPISFTVGNYSKEIENGN